MCFVFQVKLPKIFFTFFKIRGGQMLALRPPPQMTALMLMLYNIYVITVQHLRHYCTTSTSPLYNIYVTAVQHLCHYCTTYISLLYNNYVITVQRLRHYCTTSTSLLYNIYVTIVLHLRHYFTTSMSLLYNIYVTNFDIVRTCQYYLITTPR